MTKIISKYKFHLLIFTFSFLILTRFNIDPDLGWHLAIGQEFLRTGHIIRMDQFSWTIPGYVWDNSYFAYQILIASLFTSFKNFGHILTAILFGLMGSLAILILIPKKIDYWKLLVIFLGVAISTVNLGVRPQMTSFLLFAVLLFFLEKRFFQKWQHGIFLFLLFAIWANFHRGFLVGLMILVAFLLIDFFSLKSLKKNASFLIRTYCIIFAFLGTLVTPFGIALWRSALIEDLTSKENLLSIAEWRPLAIYFPVNLIFAISGLVFVYIFFRKIGKVAPSWFLIGAFLFALSFLSVNFTFFWAAIFIFLSAKHFDFKLSFGGDFWQKFPLIFSSFAIFLALLLNFVVNFGESYFLRNRLVIDNYPVLAIEFLKEKKITEGLFNEYNWGGFLDWQLPEAKIFIDGRMASWKIKDKRNILNDYLAIKRGDCDVAKNYEIKVVLIKKDDKPLCFEDWEKVYEDSVAKVLRSSSKISK